MPQPVDINGKTIQYPIVGESEWGVEATDFAVQVAGALAKIGQSTPPATNNITIPSGNLTVTTGDTDLGGTLDVTGATTLDSTLTVAGTTTLNGTANLNGNTNLGNAITDTIAVTGIVNVDSGTLYVDPVNNRIGINKTNPAQALDVTGNVAITGNETVDGTFGVTGDVAVNTNKFNITASSGDTTIAGTLGVTSDITTSGILTASNSTNVTTAPPITFTGDTNTGIGHSAADTLDLITGGNSRFRIESTGQIKAVYESQVGTDYNTQLDNGYLCRAWVNIDGITPQVRASGNVSTITKNSQNDYTINFTSNLPDINYVSIVTTGYSQNGTTASFGGSNRIGLSGNESAPLVGSCRVNATNESGSTGTGYDIKYVNVAIFR